MNNPTEHRGWLCTLEIKCMCKSHVDLALETQKMASGERRGEEEVDKEVGEKLFERTVIPLLHSGI